ncbi:hypothetical protein [Xylanimonas protaetiae]|uniref:Uncharacterized protein n=1 Tax=Xylanimonas protaetiae TaxID=2509457 RepID=A0A4P6FBA6_9MICO|nr:hypothetical protein [Xylanimonas protaetiae]QAY70737.1 hypothetical protein ET471_12485 [Xylanimonas protaetiae]
MSTSGPQPAPSAPGVVSRLVSRLRSQVAEPVTARVQAAAEEPDSPAALVRQVATVEKAVDQSSGALPPEATVLARLVTDGARQILRSGSDGGLDIHARISLAAVLRDYLPTTIARYLDAARSSEVIDVERQLVEQLGLMRQSVLETLAAVLDDDVRALEVQGAFLRTKFAAADL